MKALPPDVLPGGEIWITRERVSALEMNRPDLLSVSRKGQGIAILDRPYLMGDKVQQKDGYYLSAMPMKEIGGWPPRVNEMENSTRDPLTGLGTYERSKIQPAGMLTPLLIFFKYKGAEFKGQIDSQSEPLIRCVEATLNRHAGETLQALGEVELIGAP